MNYKVKNFFAGSRTISFFASLNKKLLLYFFNSGVYKIFIKVNTFFKNTILENAEKGTIIKSIRKVKKGITIKDIGLFIILTTLFNTFVMIVLGKEIDIFSKVARVAIIFLGIGLYVRNMRFCKK